MKPVQQPDAEETSAIRRNRMYNRIALATIFLLILLAAFFFLNREKKPAPKDFSTNFQPPISLSADYRNRHQSQPDLLVSTACNKALEEADAFYSSGNMEAARDALLLIAMEETEPCSADAWFYLGITSIALQEPMTALECLSKIDNLDDFGEDIYWYQALAFVQIAEKKPGLKQKAGGALRRFVETTRDSARLRRAVDLINALENQ